MFDSNNNFIPKFIANTRTLCSIQTRILFQNLSQIQGLYVLFKLDELELGINLSL